MNILPRFLRMRPQSFFLFGPRGTGKSTWVNAVLPRALRLDLLDPETSRLYSASPERLRDLIDGNPDQTDIIIDEIQRVPELLPAVHALMEKHRGLRFILTGSSGRKLKRGGADLLGGRAVLAQMHPFMAAELTESFSLEKALKYGTLPVAAASPTPAEVLKSYMALYIREEVQMEGLVRNIGAFARFLEAISFSHGSVLNISSVGRECGVERKVVEAYTGILEDLLIAWRLPVFTKRAQRATVAHPKFYLFDTGVYRALRPTGPLDRTQDVDGCALEGLVAQHFRAWLDYGSRSAKMYYWRSVSGNEVDFILYGEKTFFAVEVKNSNRVRPEDLRGLRTFHADYPECTPLLLYRGRERLKTGGVLCVPCEPFLKNLAPDRDLTAVLR